MDKLPKYEELPCGNTAQLEEGYAYRCQTCMAIWGSIGCGCSNELRKIEKDKKKTKIPFDIFHKNY